MSTLPQINLIDVIANRPVAGTGAGAGRIFYATDTGLAYRDNGSSWDQITTAAPVASGPFTTPPLIGTFTWMNQAGGVAATASQASGPYPNVLSINIPDTGATLNWKMLTRPVPGATPYRLIVCIRSTQFEKNSQNSGVYFSDGTKLMGIEFLTQGGSAQSFLRVEKMNNVTTDNSTAAQWPSGSFAEGGPPFGDLWVQLRNDGAKLYFDWSKDGCVFYNLFNENIGVFITPTVYGVGGISVCNSASYFVQVSLMSWQELNT